MGKFHLLLQLQRCSLSTFTSKAPPTTPTLSKWNITQVTKSNFPDSIQQIKTDISNSHFIAVSLQRTGYSSAPWHRISAVDTADTAYFKAKHAAESFQVLQFAVCPFTIEGTKVIAYPYNFHLFPRDELKIGMPSYSFSCQPSRLASMAQVGFDFNACIYDGISYLSRVQESKAKVRIGDPVHVKHTVKTSSSPSVADNVFVERIKYRIKQWKIASNPSTLSSDKGANEALLTSLRKLVLGSQMYMSRPSIDIDVCSERQVQLTLEMLAEFSEDLVPFLIPRKGGGTQAVRVVLTSSKEDKDLLERELQDIDEEQSKRIRGFREVIDLIAASKKPLLSSDLLNDLTSIHYMFLGPLPATKDEFLSSLRLDFHQVYDVNHLMKEVVPQRRITNVAASLSFLENRFFAPIDIEVSSEATEDKSKIHGHNVVYICHLFAKLCSILKIAPVTSQSDGGHHGSSLERFANFFEPGSSGSHDPFDKSVKVWTKNVKRVYCQDIVFLWGFQSGISAGVLKEQLQGSHEVFFGDFDVRMVDKSCAIVVFWKAGSSQSLVSAMDGDEISGSVKELVSNGFRAASYEVYKRICELGYWEADLADAFDKLLVDSDSQLKVDAAGKASEIYWHSDFMIHLDEL